MKKRSYEDRIREVEHSSFTALISATVGWLMKPQHFTNDLPPSYLRDGPTNMLLLWAGFVVVYHFLYYIQPSDVWGVLVLLVDVLVGPLHLLKLTLFKRSQSFPVQHNSLTIVFWIIAWCIITIYGYPIDYAMKSITLDATISQMI